MLKGEQTLQMPQPCTPWSITRHMEWRLLQADKRRLRNDMKLSDFSPFTYFFLKSFAGNPPWWADYPQIRDEFLRFTGSK